MMMMVLLLMLLLLLLLLRACCMQHAITEGGERVTPLLQRPIRRGQRQGKIEVHPTCTTARACASRAVGCRFQMPAPQVLREGAKKTVFANFTETVKVSAWCERVSV